MYSSAILSISSGTPLKERARASAAAAEATRSPRSFAATTMVQPPCKEKLTMDISSEPLT